MLYVYHNDNKTYLLTDDGEYRWIKEGDAYRPYDQPITPEDLDAPQPSDAVRWYADPDDETTHYDVFSLTDGKKVIYHENGEEVEMVEENEDVYQILLDRYVEEAIGREESRLWRKLDDNERSTYTASCRQAWTKRNGTP